MWGLHPPGRYLGIPKRMRVCSSAESYPPLSIPSSARNVRISRQRTRTTASPLDHERRYSSECEAPYNKPRSLRARESTQCRCTAGRQVERCAAHILFGLIQKEKNFNCLTRFRSAIFITEKK